MGKVSKSKKRGAVSSSGTPYGSRSEGPRQEDPSTIALIADMKSIDPVKRTRACDLVASIYSHSLDGVAPMISLDNLASEELLGVLRMRLGDSHEHVRTAAMGALRSMSLCKDQRVAAKLHICGLSSMALQLTREALQSLSPANIQYAEGLLSLLSNLCVTGEAVVLELSSPLYINGLLGLVASPPSPRLLLELTGLLLVITDSNPLACSAILQYSTSIASSGLQCLVNVMTTSSLSYDATGSVDATASHDMKIASLNCAGIIVHFLSAGTSDCGHPHSVGSALITAIETAQTSAASGVSVLRAMLMLLCESMKLSDEITQDCFAPDVPVKYADISAVEGQAVESGSFFAPAPPTSNSRPDGSEDVIIGAEAVDRPSSRAFEVIKLAIEIFANFCVAAKERCHTAAALASSGQTSASTDWAAMNEDEGEKLMNEIVSSLPDQCVPLIKTEDETSPYAHIIVESGAARLSLDLLHRLNLVLERMVSQVSAGTLGPDGSPFALSSSILLVLGALESLMSCVSNLADFAVLPELDAISQSLCGLLISSTCLSMDILFGVTPSSSFSSSDKPSMEWALSPCLDPKQTWTAARMATLAGSRAITSMYCNCYKESHSRPVLLIPSPGQFTAASPVGVSAAMPSLVSYAMRALAVPILEVNSTVFELISCLAEAGGTFALSPPENKVLSEALLKRLTDPKAVTCTPKELLGGTADASLAIMAGCFSTLVDLHSSDDPAYLQNFVDLSVLSCLNSRLNDFKAKVQVEGHLVDREELCSYKEISLNIKRFIKYKSSFV